jgi:hypothetical protein
MSSPECSANLIFAPASHSRERKRRSWRLAALLAASVFAGGGVAGCASAADYNPQNLDAAQLGQIARICQSTMGLSPDEAYSPIWGAAQDPRLDPGENHYQGCVASLSDALRAESDGMAVARADEQCRAQGYKDGGADLAECVLHWRDTHVASAQQDAPAAQANLVSQTYPQTGARSFYTAWPGEIARREREACAQLGLDPAEAAFDQCVSHMDNTFYRIDNPNL